MVEIDGEVIKLAKEFLPNIAAGAWDDTRADVIVGDGIAYVRDAADASFDVIIVDSTDPAGVGEVLFSDELPLPQLRTHSHTTRSDRRQASFG